MGARVDEDDDSVTVTATRRLRPITVVTKPYPGFPTDMHPQFSALFCTVAGESTMIEKIFQNRFRYVEELNKMGANIVVNGDTAKIDGTDPLNGATVKAVDLRAGAALIIAGLAAEGKTVITDVESIQRGYCNIVKNFRELGADIEEMTFATPILIEE